MRRTGNSGALDCATRQSSNQLWDVWDVWAVGAVGRWAGQRPPPGLWYVGALFGLEGADGRYGIRYGMRYLCGMLGMKAAASTDHQGRPLPLGRPRFLSTTTQNFCLPPQGPRKDCFCSAPPFSPHQPAGRGHRCDRRFRTPALAIPSSSTLNIIAGLCGYDALAHLESYSSRSTSARVH